MARAFDTEAERRLHENGLALLYCDDESRREILLAERESLLAEIGRQERANPNHP